MKKTIGNPQVEDYIDSQLEKEKERLRQIQSIIRIRVPEAIEEMEYGIPSFALDGRVLAHYATGEKHTVFYPGATVIDHFRERLFSYSPTKEAIHFPHRLALPVDLIEEMVLFKLRQYSKGLK